MGSVDHVGVITEETMTALASMGLDIDVAGTAGVITELTGEMTDLGGVGLGGVVTTCVLGC